MTDNFKEGEPKVEENQAFDLWKGLGFEEDRNLTPAQKLEIISTKINTGELELEQVKAALDLVK